jgi:hypothetical protein
MSFADRTMSFADATIAFATVEADIAKREMLVDG